MRPRLRFLSEELIQQILEEAYKLLETRGINLNHDLLLGRFADLGCRVDRAGKRMGKGEHCANRCGVRRASVHRFP